MKKKIIFLSIFILLLIVGGVGIFYFTQSNRDAVTFADGDAKYKTETKETPKDGTLPEDHNSYDNLAYVLWVLEHQKYYSSKTEGTSVSVGQTQVIYNHRVVNGEEQLVDTVTSGLVSLGKQKYFKDGKVLIRDYISKDGDVITWKDEEPECITYKGFISRYGSLPTYPSAYIICKDTILEISETIQLENGQYSITVSLNPDWEYAPFWYRREVSTNASSITEPVFSEIKLEYIFDSDWRVHEIKTKEKYTVTPKVAPLTVNCDTNISEVFDYEHFDLDADSLEFYKKYENLTPSDGSVEPSENTPLSYITGSLLGSNSKEKTFDIFIKIDEKEIQGKLALDITDLNDIGVKLSLGDLQIIYQNKTVFMDYNSIKIKGNVDEVKEVISPLLDAIVLKNMGGNSSTSSIDFDVNKIINDLNNATVIETENHVQLDLVLDLSILKLPLTFDISKNGNDLDLLSIKSDILSNPNLSVLIEKNESIIFFPIDGEYQDVKNIEFILSDLAEIIKKDKFNLDFNLTIDQFILSGNAYTDLANSIVKINLDVLNQVIHLDEHIELIYKDSYFYVNYRNIRLKLSQTELINLINKYLPDLSNNPQINLNSLLEILFEVNLQSVLSNIIFEENHIGITLDLSQFIEGLGPLSVNITNTEEGFNISIKEYDINLSVDTTKVEEISIEEGNYTDISGYIGLIEYFMNIVSKESFGIEMNGSINVKGQELSLNGNIDFLLNEKEYTIEGNISVSYVGQTVEVKVLFIGKEIYVSLYGQTIKFNVDTIGNTIKEITEQLGIELSSIETTSIELSQILELLNTVKIYENKVEIHLQEILEVIGIISLGYEIEGNDVSGTIENEEIKINLGISKIEGRIPEVPSTYYTETEILKLVEYAKDIVEVVRNKRAAIEISGNYEGVKINGNIYAEWESELKVKASLMIGYKEETIEIEIYYIHNEVFVHLNEGIQIKVSVEEIIEIIKEYLPIPNVNVDINSMIAMLKAFTIGETEVEIVLDLSKILPEMNSVSVQMTNTEEGFNISIKEYDINLSVDTTKVEEISIEEGNYTDISGYIEQVKYISSLLFKESIHISLDGQLHLSNLLNLPEGMDITIGSDSYIDLVFVDGDYEIDGKLILDIASLKQIISFQIVRKKIYISYGSLSFELALTEIPELVNHIKEEFQLNENTSSSFDSISAILNLLTINENSILFDLSSMIESLSFVTLSMQFLTLENEITGSKLELMSSVFQCNAIISPSTRTEVIVPQNNLQLEEIKNLISSIKNIITGILESDGLSLNLDLTAYGISLLGAIQVTKDMNVYADLTAGVKDSAGIEHKLEFSAYYVDHQLYVSFNGIQFVFDSEDFNVILTTIEELIGPIIEYIKKIISSMNLDLLDITSSREETVLNLVLNILQLDPISLKTIILKDSIELSGKISEQIELNSFMLSYGLSEIPTLEGEYLDVSNLVSMFENLENGVSSTGQLSIDALGYNILLPYQMQFKLDLIELMKGQNLFHAIELELVIDSEFYSPITLTIMDGILYLDSMETKFKYLLPQFTIQNLFETISQKEINLNIEQMFIELTRYLNAVVFETKQNALSISFSSELSQMLNTLIENLLGLEVNLKDVGFSLSNLSRTTADFNISASVNVFGLDLGVDLSTQTTASNYVSNLTELDKEQFVLTTDFKDHPFAKRLLDILTMIKGIAGLDYSGNGQKFDLNIPLEVDSGLIKSCVVSGDLGVALDLQGILDGNDIWSSFKINTKINIKAETKLFVNININVWLFYIGDGYLYLIVDGTAAGIGFKISEMIVDLRATLAEGLGTSSEEVSTIYLNDLLNRVINGFTTEQSGNKTTLVLAPAAVEVVNTLWRSLVDMANEQIATLNVSALTSLINSIANFNMDVTGFTLIYTDNGQNQIDNLKVVLSGYRHGTYVKTELPITISSNGALDSTYFDSASAKANETAYVTAKTEMSIARDMVNALGEFQYTPEFYAQAKEVQSYLDSMSELAKASYSSTYPSEMIQYYEQLLASEQNLKEILIVYAESGISGLNYDIVLGCYEAYLYFRNNGIVLSEEEFELYLSIYNTMALESLLDFANRVDSFIENQNLDFENNSSEILAYRDALNDLYNEYWNLSSSYKDAFKYFYNFQYEKLLQMVGAYDLATSLYVNEKIYSYISNDYNLEEAQSLYREYGFESSKNYILDHSNQTFAWDLLKDFIYMSFINELDKEIGKAIEGGIIPELVITIPQLEARYELCSDEFKTYFRYSMEKLRTMLEPSKVKFVEVTKALLDQFELTRESVNYGAANAQKAYYYDYSKLMFTEENAVIGKSLVSYFGYSSETEIATWYNDNDAFTKFKVIVYCFDFIESVNDSSTTKEELQAKFDILNDSSVNFYYTKYVTGIWGSKKVHNETHSFAEIFIKSTSGLAYTCYQSYLQRINS